MTTPLGPISFDRAVAAVARVKQRLIRAVIALESAEIPYAVVGGHAIAAWVARVDESATRNTPDVDILLRRPDFEAASAALTNAGFVASKDRDFNVFLDEPGTKIRDAVRIYIAGEKVRPEDAREVRDVAESEQDGAFRVLALPALIRMNLTSFRIKDQVHLLDLIDVGLIDQSTVATVPPELAPRLQELIDNPES